ncbi:uncharacterized protein LOC108096576 [Drosophila ficusphila]|uniref:uncharacterized protein LOC108096576 n=1 Tax=Drosophila ficusphila TaxID=30025 RepID=UPI0007E5CF5C|nr:uncharacterized protein LOC108096576 [Drosophila ficusphila]
MIIYDEFKTLCSSLFEDSMRLVCSGLVPVRLSKKYQNRLFEANDPYSIFQSNNSNVLIFRYLEMFQCRTIHFDDIRTIDCLNKYGARKSLYFSYSHQVCYDHTMSLTAELKKHCGAMNYDGANTRTGYYFTNHDLNATTLITDTASLLESPTLVFCLIISFLLITILRWKVFPM